MSWHIHQAEGDTYKRVTRYVMFKRRRTYPGDSCAARRVKYNPRHTFAKAAQHKACAAVGS